MEYSARLNGTKGTMVSWIVSINGIDFEYNEGIGHFFNFPHIMFKDPMKVYAELAQEIVNKRVGAYLNGKAVTPLKDRVKCKKRGTWANGCPDYHISEITPPELDAVLYAIVMDADALDMCFDDWCDNYGYDNDSKSDEKVYLACVENGHKARKAGISIYAERERLANY